MSQCKSHCFHADCLQSQLGDKSYLKCAVCNFTYGQQTGSMPDGTMTVQHISANCAGHTGGSLQICYQFAGGMTPAGTKYFGDSRTCFLPATDEGIEVLYLLQLAFKRRLTFVVGFSVTRGRDDCIVWNGIHHKTQLGGGAYGYPDPTYFSRVKEELASKGVVFPDEHTRVNCRSMLQQSISP